MKKTCSMRFADILSALLGIGMGTLAIVMTMSFKQFKNVPVGPEVFPRIMAVGLIVCSAALLVQALIKKAPVKASTLSLRDRGVRHMLSGAAVMAVFYLLWETAGFLILAPLALCGLMRLGDYRNYKLMALIAVVASVAVWLLFWQVLSIELPLGPIDFVY